MKHTSSSSNSAAFVSIAFSRTANVMEKMSEFSKLRRTLRGETTPSTSSHLSSISPPDRRRKRRVERSLHSRENSTGRIETSPHSRENSFDRRGINTRNEIIAQPVPVPAEEEAYIAIGIDLGTTYSGVAWSLSTSPNDIVIVSSWETDDIPRSTDLHKVPSLLTYGGNGEVTSWGYRLDEERNAFNWFKLLLSEQATEKLAQDQPDRYARLLVLLQKFDKEPIDVVADYLRCVWEHVKEDIQGRIDDWLWDNLKLKIVLTVPAIWDHKAQEMTRRAAEKAGLLERTSTSLELIGEPEAAALEVFTEMRTQKRGNLVVGDTFIVCDAGGGTVLQDRATKATETFNVLGIDWHGFHQFQGTSADEKALGGLCGAIFVDGAFEKQMRTLISNEDYESLDRYAKRSMMRNWEYFIKRTFKTGGKKETWNVDIPGYQGIQVATPNGSCPSVTKETEPEQDLPAGMIPHRSLAMLRINSPFLSQESLNRVNPGTVLLRIGHLTAIFSEVCSKITDLVNTQRTVIKSIDGKEPAAILLVGGFGENMYLKQQLQQSFGSSGIKIQQPTKAWAAICRGAVLRGLGNNIVINHISKYSYGCTFDPEFVEGVHSEQDRVYKPISGIYAASSQMRWFLIRGENVAKEAPVTHDFYWALTNSAQLKEVFLNIHYSNSTVPEIRQENGVKLLCSVKVVLDEFDWDNLPTEFNPDGEAWKKIDFSLELKISSGQLCWSVKRNGLDIGSAITSVKYEGMVD